MRVMKRWYDEGDDEMIQSNVIFPGKETVVAAAAAAATISPEMES